MLEKVGCIITVLVLRELKIPLTFFSLTPAFIFPSFLTYFLSITMHMSCSMKVSKKKKKIDPMLGRITVQWGDSKQIST